MSQETEQPKERRKAERFAPPLARVIAQATPFAPKGGNVEASQTGSFIGLLGQRVSAKGELLDISARGLRFVSDKKLAPNIRLKIAASFGQSQEKLECVGTVRWVHAHTGADKFVVGVEFDPLLEDQSRFLGRLRKATV